MAYYSNLLLKADHPPSGFFGFVLSFVAAGVGLAQALGRANHKPRTCIRVPFRDSNVAPTMPAYTDIYVLSQTRRRESINRFLDEFMPFREESAAEYASPQYSDSPHTIFRNASEFLDYICEHVDEAHSIYWRSAGDSKPEHAMAFFLPDRYVIYGISTEASEVGYVDEITRRLKVFFETSEILLLFEQPPPDTAVEFRKQYKGA